MDADMQSRNTAQGRADRGLDLVVEVLDEFAVASALFKTHYRAQLGQGEKSQVISRHAVCCN
jgi:hypothetical protein